MPEPQLNQPEERVLSTLDNTGKRRWLWPRLSKGRFLRWRVVVGYALIVLFTAIPYIRINDKPALLFDVLRREFHIFGKTFWPTDFALLALFGIGTLVLIFLVTSLFGRVWCGWGCPQTVYLELVYRPIERLFAGTSGKGGKPRRPVAGWRTGAKYLVYLLVSIFLAHVFLAYFVGVDQLFEWVQGSPFEHPIAFAIIAFTTGLMMFDFCYFREQMCIVACPYGRLQSVLLDRQSLVISYDPLRGEPRGPLKKGPRGRATEQGPVPLTFAQSDANEGHSAVRPLDGSADSTGDCIDCYMCATTCPTGIDIRDGLQLECVNCAQCIDACDAVMDKIGRPRGLIRYSSQQAIEGVAPRLLRPRVILYPLVICTIIGLFIFTLGTKSVAEVIVYRAAGKPFHQAADGRIGNTLRLEIANRTDAPLSFDVSLADAPQMELQLNPNPLTLAPGARQVAAIQVLAPRKAFQTGIAYVTLVVRAENYEHASRERLLGPVGPPSRATPSAEPTHGEIALPSGSKP